MSVSRDDVKRIAELSCLSFGEQELEPFTEHFQEILDYIEQLRAVPTDAVEPMAHALMQEVPLTPMRDDEVAESLEPTRAVREAPDQSDNQFLVPKVIE